MSYAGAMTVAQQYPQFADQITAVLISAVLVFFLFPNKDDERKMLVEYHRQDMAEMSAAAPPESVPAPGGD